MRYKNSVDRTQVRQNFEQLPKGAYVIKMLDVKEVKNKNSDSYHLEISFDIAEGDYKDFYKKAYQNDTREDKKWSYDAVYYLAEPDENSEDWVIKNWNTFWAAVEDSNDGYVFDGDEKKAKNKLVGGLFRIEQTESNGRVYNHTRLTWVRQASDIRDGKYGNLPQDKLFESPTVTSSDDFMSIPEGAEEALPF